MDNEPGDLTKYLGRRVRVICPYCGRAVGRLTAGALDPRTGDRYLLDMATIVPPLSQLDLDDPRRGEAHEEWHPLDPTRLPIGVRFEEGDRSQDADQQRVPYGAIARRQFTTAVTVTCKCWTRNRSHPSWSVRFDRLEPAFLAAVARGATEIVLDADV